MMKIIDENEERFETLAKGDVFKFSWLPGVYMKVKELAGYNAVRLETGDLVMFGTEDEVTRLDATLTARKMRKK